MSKTEITMRLLSAEAGIQLQHMRKGTMREEDWTRLASTMGRVSEAPLFIDDSPNMSLMEIRAKCRRLKQRDNLKLVVIDYLQLMSSRQAGRVAPAGGLRVLPSAQAPGQGARGPRRRDLPAQPRSRAAHRQEAADVRPSRVGLSDRRDASTASRHRGRDVDGRAARSAGETDVPVWSLDESLRYVRRHLTQVFSTGTRPVFTTDPVLGEAGPGHREPPLPHVCGVAGTG